MAARPSSVLFACNLNRVRSPMAAALARQMGGARLVADSCGLLAADDIDPFAAAVMGEVGLDLSEHQPKAFEAVPAAAFDMVVSLTPEAHRRAMGTSGIETEYWPIADPTAASGSREQRLDAYREVREELKRRIAELLARPSTSAGRSG